MMASANEPYDIIFAGGGASACVTAGRLAMADPSLKILILEAGPLTQEMPDHIQPALYFSNLILPAETFTLHASKPSPSLAGRSVIVPTGRCLGGGSSVNFAMYTRAAASDYDDWESVYSNPGWGSKHLIPLLKKAETFQTGGDPATHGTNGPIKASFADEEINVGSQFLAVASQYDKERGFTEDANSFFTCNVYGKWPRYVDATNGRRSDVPHSYIYNQAENKNLKILERRRVVRVIFEGNRAVGVEHVGDAVGRAKGVQEPSASYASRLVVVSAGAFGSPAILERSGIGAADVLEKNKISQIVDLPGVGEHYMDHNLIFAPYIASEDADTLDVIFRGKQAEVEPFAKRWLQDGKGLMSHNGLDAGIKIRPNAEDLKEIGRDFEARWKSYFENAPDKPVMWIGTLAAYAGVNPATPPGKYFSLAYYTEYPVSTGRVHITSGIDAYGKLEFEPGYLDDPADVGVLRWAYKKSREIARRMDSYRGELELGHPEYPKGSKAGSNGSVKPVDVSSPDIAYCPEDDKAIDDYHRKNVETSWHSIGTCAMKPREKGGVVDARLNVYGIQNLKIADCSIAPSNVGANTYNTALAIGEKAAVIIAQDLGIKGVSEA
ncbi:GMC oxidoreductase-domain-containing protein [Lyophyllum atratum]|nr:GMC oxidoreductase-domain-containing protein [Lyophyllum atratum]